MEKEVLKAYKNKVNIKSKSFHIKAVKNCKKILKYKWKLFEYVLF